MQRFIVGNCLSSDSLHDCVIPLGSIIVTLLFFIYITLYQTVWILVLLECTWTTVTLPFLHLPYLIVIHRSIINWNILISGLNLNNVTKTEFTITSLRLKLQSFNDYTINIDVDGIQVNQTIHSKSPGLNTDDLSWKPHIHVHDISKRVSSTHCSQNIPTRSYCTTLWLLYCCLGWLVATAEWYKLPKTTKSHCQNHTVVADNFLTCLIGTTYQLEGQ